MAARGGTTHLGLDTRGHFRCDYLREQSFVHPQMCLLVRLSLHSRCACSIAVIGAFTAATLTQYRGRMRLVLCNVAALLLDVEHCGTLATSARELHPLKACTRPRWRR